MKVKIISERRDLMGEFYSGDILDGKIYDVTKIHTDVPLYDIIDESGDEFSYPSEMFEVVEK